jgi:hypothetical protein
MPACIPVAFPKEGRACHKRRRTQTLGGMCFLRMWAARVFASPWYVHSSLRTTLVIYQSLVTRHSNFPSGPHLYSCLLNIPTPPRR